MNSRLRLWLPAGILSSLALAATPAVDRDQDIQRAYEKLRTEAGVAEVRWRGAEALFEKKLPLAALHLLRELGDADWNAMPRGKERRRLLSALFHGQVPEALWSVRADDTPAKKAYREGISAVRKNDLAQAESTFRQGLARAADEAMDVGPEVASEALASLWKIESGRRVARARGQSQLALARVAYARADYPAAISRYRSARTDVAGSEVDIERTWSLLASEQWSAALESATLLADSAATYSALVARLQRAIALVGLGRTEEAKLEAERLSESAERYLEAVQTFLRFNDAESLPEAIGREVSEVASLKALSDFDARLRAELVALGREDSEKYPVFARLAAELVPWRAEARLELGKALTARLGPRPAQVEALLRQAKLVRIEALLTEAETTPAQRQSALRGAFDEQKSLLDGLPERPAALEFRHAELAWELGMREEALQSVRSLLARAPAFPLAADARFLLGFGEVEQGRFAEGTVELERMVADHPKHERTADALRILGDLRFDAEEFEAAMGYFGRVLDFPKSPLVGYAQYRMGWCAYRLNRGEEALTHLRKGIIAMKQVPQSAGLNLSAEAARKDLVSLYAEIGEPRRALTDFSAIFGVEAGRALTELAREYEETAQMDKGADVYRGLINLQPSSPENLARQTAILRTMIRLERWKEITEELRRLAFRHALELKTPSTDGPAAEAEALARELVLTQYARLGKRPSDEETARVRDLEEAYLRAFETWPQSREPLYAHARTMLDRGQLPKAVVGFKAHWQKFGAGLAEPLREEALRLLVHALERVEEGAKADGKRLGRATEDLLTFSQQYVKAYPDGPYTRPIAYLRSAVLLKYGRTEEGKRESQAIFDADPLDDIGGRAYHNLKTTYYQTKNWPAIRAWSESVLRNEKARDYFPELEALRREAAFRNAEEMKDDVASATAFLAVAREPAFAAVRDESYNNAFVRLEKAGRKRMALDVAEEFERSTPDAKLLKELSAMRAALYQDAGDYARAYPLFQQFLQQPPEGVRPEAITQATLNIALIAEALGKVEEAGDHFSRLVAEAGDVTGPVIAEAQAGLKRLGGDGEREPAVASSKWTALQRSRDEFEKQPLPRRKDIVGSIKEGAARLQALAKRHLDFAKEATSPKALAFEAYCAVPLLYQSYTSAIHELAREAPAAAQGELMMFVTPLETQAVKLAEECLTRADEAEHDGDVFQRVRNKWGWDAARNPEAKFRVQRLLELLDGDAPWMEPVPLALGESEILEKHLERPGTADTWYALGRARLRDGRTGLARLTFVDSIAKHGRQGRLLNALALIEAAQPGRRGIPALFEAAGTAGSHPAWANLAHLQLRAGRLSQAIEPLHRALRSGVFDKNETLKLAVQEFLVTARRR